MTEQFALFHGFVAARRLAAGGKSRNPGSAGPAFGMIFKFTLLDSALAQLPAALGTGRSKGAPVNFHHFVAAAGPVLLPFAQLFGGGPDSGCRGRQLHALVAS